MRIFEAVLCLLQLCFTGRVAPGRHPAGAEGARSWKVQPAQPGTCCRLLCSFQPRGSRCLSPSRDASGLSKCPGEDWPGNTALPPRSLCSRLIAASSSPVPLFHQHRSGLGAVVLSCGKASDVSAVSLRLNSYLGSHATGLTGSDVDSGVCW